MGELAGQLCDGQQGEEKKNWMQHTRLDLDTLTPDPSAAGHRFCPPGT